MKKIKFILFICRYISGIIARDVLDQFCRVLWRSSRGNIFLRTSEIDDDIFDPKSVVMTIPRFSSLIEDKMNHYVLHLFLFENWVQKIINLLYIFFFTGTESSKVCLCYIFARRPIKYKSKKDMRDNGSEFVRVPVKFAGKNCSQKQDGSPTG